MTTASPAMPFESPRSESPVGPSHVRAQGLEIGDLLRILSERRYIILGAAALGLILAIIISLAMTPMYRAEAMLELNSASNEVIDEASGQGQGSAPRGTEQMATNLGLLRSESLAQRVAQDLNLVSRPEYGGAGPRNERLKTAAAVLQSNLLVAAVKGSNLIKVDYESPDPTLAARIANAFSKGFIASNLERRYDASSYAREFLSDQLGKTKAELEDSERALNDYAIDSGIFRSPGQVSNGVVTEGTSLAATNLQSLNEALNAARIKRIQAEQDYLSSAADMSDAANNAAADLQNQRELLRAEYDEKLKVFKEDYPEMIRLQQRIASLDRSISSTRSNATGGKRADQLAKYRAAQAAENQIKAQVGSYKGEVQDERVRSTQYNILQREVDTNRALYDALLQRFKEIGVAGGIGKSDISQVDEAEAPRAPFRPNLPLNAAMGIAAGLALGVLLAVATHLLFDTIVTPADVRNKLAMPVIGVVPEESSDRPLIEALDDRKSDISEAYFSVRTALRFADPAGLPKTLLLTSTRPGEGKSTSAYAIASSLARSGMNVLLIDADLRKPTFVSRHEQGRGFAWLLGSEEPLATYVEATKTANLTLLPVGRYTASAAELLASTRLPRIVEEAANSYEIVIFDGPPVLGLADAPLLGALIEKTIVVIESRSSRTANVSEMVRRLQASGTRIIGVLLTKVRESAGGYSYYSYSYGTQDVGGKVSSDPGRSLDVNSGETTAGT